MDTRLVKIHDVFSRLFDIDDNVFSAIKENMEEFGYDDAQPLVLWQGKNIVIDGHTRLRAAKALGIDDVPVVERFFRDEDDALAYAFHAQRDRRNITSAELLRAIQYIDKRKERGKHTGNQHTGVEKASHDAISKSAKETADIIGTSQATVERARTVLSDGDATQAVLSGEKTISAAAKEVKEKQSQTTTSHATFNKTNDNIEWAQWTWNPVTGCKHGCPYCYARDIAERFYPQKFEPTFHENRLSAPFNTKQPSNPTIGERNVFVCSMADLFGDWVPQEWIDKVLDVCRKTPQWNYLFLTKNPKRYIGIEWPDNAWVGTTADTEKRLDAALDIFKQIKAPVRFLSCEPLKENIASGVKDLSCVDWLIIGGQSKTTGEPAFQPEWVWVENLMVNARRGIRQHSINPLVRYQTRIYFKPNLTVVPKEYPCME